MSVTKKQMMTLLTGDRLKFSYGKNHPSNFTLYVVGSVLDTVKTKEPRILIITKQWNKYRRRWNYEVNSVMLLSPSWDDITLIRKRRAKNWFRNVL